MNSDGVEIAEQKFGQWVYWDHIRISLPDPERAPRLTGERYMGDDDKDQYAFEPVDIAFRFLWDTEASGWVLYEVEASGPRVLDDGTYDGEELICRTFSDPLDNDPNNDEKAPDWLIRLADERVGLIPVPPRKDTT